MMNLRDFRTLQLPFRRLAKFIGNAQETYPLIVFDCNPSSSFTSWAALQLATHVFVPVRADRYSVLGVDMVRRYIEQIVLDRPKPKMNIVINDVTDDDPEVVKASQELRGHTVYGPLVLANMIKHTELLRAKSDYTGFARDKKVSHKKNVRSMLTKVAMEYADALGFHDE